MKFIRDIIAEKTNMAVPDTDVGTEGEIDNLETPGAEIKMANNVDRVRVEAPTARPQVRAALAAFGNVDREVISDDQPVAEIQDDFDGEMDDSFDLLDEQGGGLDPQYQVETDGESSPEPFELFADIWETENVTDTADDTLPDEPTAENVATQGYNDPFFGETEMGHKSSKQDIFPTAPEPVPEGTPEVHSPFDRIETEPAQAVSTFQRFRRKQTASATGQESAKPEVIPAINSTHDPMTPVKVPAPAAGRSRRQAGRVKTRLLGFGNDQQQDGDLFANGTNTGPAAQAMFPVGWMVVVAGPGCGTAFALQNGVSQIGRGEGQAVRLDYGDTSISRENHAAVAYDPEQREFFLGHGGKANLVRLNGKPVLSTEPLSNGALIRIGETTLRFVGFCGSEFDWGNSQVGGDENVQVD
jgi:hypothetical protein